MNVTNSFDQFSLVLSIRGRICDFLPCTRELDHALHSIERNQPQCRVCDGLTYNVKSKLFLVSLRGCNCLAKILKEKLNQWLLLLIITLLNLTVAKLTAIMPMSSACYSLWVWIIVCCAVTYIVYCVRQAYGTRVRRLTLIYHNWPCWPRIFSHNSMPLR